MKKYKSDTNIIKPSLPPIHELIPYLLKIWKSKILTNIGPIHNEFERKLEEYLDADHISIVSNATSGLILTLRALDIRGEVITTPYTFVATTHALKWLGIKPVFIDVNKDDYNINYKLIEDKITSKTSAILAVHCYGNPCQVEELEKIAEKYNLKLILDAAQAFGSNILNRNLLKAGDASILSFHATKVFNTLEGGAIVTRSLYLKKQLDLYRNFGFSNEDNINVVGLNAKMNELSASIGIIQLKYIDKYLRKRRLVSDRYQKVLKDNNWFRLNNIRNPEKYNYAYFPIIINKNYPLSRDNLVEELRKKGYNVRKYFFPLISNLEMYRNEKGSNIENLPISNELADSVICLPIYPDLKKQTQNQLIKYLLNPSLMLKY